MNVDAALAAAFRAAEYRIHLPDRTLVRRVGLVDPEADTALQQAGCHHRWSIITPCNPGSRRLPEHENQQRLREMEDQLRSGTYHWLRAENGTEASSAVSAVWHEPRFCLFDADPDNVLRLATAYGQLAVVSTELGQAPMLAWTELS